MDIPLAHQIIIKQFLKMSWTKKQADNVNKSVQFEVREAAQSVSLKWNAEITDSHKNDMLVQVELVSKNKANQTLYKQKVSELKSILKQFLPKMKDVLPFAFGKSLSLNDDNYLLVTITFPNIADVQVTNFEYSLNTYVQATESPLIIKEINIADEKDINTEFYPVILLGADVEQFQTVVMLSEANGVLVPKKVFYNKSLISSLIDADSDYLPVAVANQQTVTVQADNKKVYLLNI